MTQLLTPESLAHRLALSTQTIYNRMQSGDLPPHLRLGRLPRWRESDVDDWLAAKVVPMALPAPVAHLIARRQGRPTKAEQIARRSMG